MILTFPKKTWSRDHCQRCCNKYPLRVEYLKMRYFTSRAGNRSAARYDRNISCTITAYYNKGNVAIFDSSQYIRKGEDLILFILYEAGINCTVFIHIQIWWSGLKRPVFLNILHQHESSSCGCRLHSDRISGGGAVMLYKPILPPCSMGDHNNFTLGGLTLPTFKLQVPV